MFVVFLKNMDLWKRQKFEFFNELHDRLRNAYYPRFLVSGNHESCALISNCMLDDTLASFCRDLQFVPYFDDIQNSGQVTIYYVTQINKHFGVQSVKCNIKLQDLNWWKKVLIQCQETCRQRNVDVKRVVLASFQF